MVPVQLREAGLQRWGPAPPSRHLGPPPPVSPRGRAAMRAVPRWWQRFHSRGWARRLREEEEEGGHLAETSRGCSGSPVARRGCPCRARRATAAARGGPWAAPADRLRAVPAPRGHRAAAAAGGEAGAARAARCRPDRRLRRSISARSPPGRAGTRGGDRGATSRPCYAPAGGREGGGRGHFPPHRLARPKSRRWEEAEAPARLLRQRQRAGDDPPREERAAAGPPQRPGAGSPLGCFLLCREVLVIYFNYIYAYFFSPQHGIVLLPPAPLFHTLGKSRRAADNRVPANEGKERKAAEKFKKKSVKYQKKTKTNPKRNPQKNPNHTSPRVFRKIPNV